MPEKKVTKILWTGGWDSTFRLLQLLLQNKTQVQPYYLADLGRRSTALEIETINKIKKYLIKKYPHTEELLLPLKISKVSDLKPDQEIKKAFKDILKNKIIGEQYEWLARFCKQNKIHDIELCIHCDDKAHKVIAGLVKNQSINGTAGPSCDPSQSDQAGYLLFEYFVFPIFELSKLEMRKISKEKSWNKIMNMTWFCHKPIFGKIPCGRCNPCLYTIEEGLGKRIPIYIRILNKLG